MLARTAVVALIVALGGIACAPPTLDSEHSSNASAESGSNGSSGSSKKSPKSKVAKDDDLGDDDDGSDTGGTTTKSNGSSNAGAGTGTGTGTGTETAAAPPPTFDAVYTKLNATCGSGGCHLAGTSGAPIFFGADKATTYGIFKDQQFAASTPSPLEARGAHLGPAMTADQKSAVDAWVTADPGGP